MFLEPRSSRLVELRLSPPQQDTAWLLFEVRLVWGRTVVLLCEKEKPFRKNSRPEAPQLHNVFHLGLVPVVPECLMPPGEISSTRCLRGCGWKSHLLCLHPAYRPLIGGLAGSRSPI